MTTTGNRETIDLKTLPADEARRILWRFAGRTELVEVIESVRRVARGPVARLVAGGGRSADEWTEEKAALLCAFDDAGLTALFMDPEDGGLLAEPKNLALGLAAFELAWVDGGAATCSLASYLALAPIHERGTPDQRAYYMGRCSPRRPGEDREVWRGAFCLTEPLPYVGVDTGVLSGKVRVSSWEEGSEPVLEVKKRGRFIINMGIASFVTAAVESDDERLRGSCMVILEATDEGRFERGVATRKLVHQLSAAHDPSFDLKVPASRIVGGYTVENGVIVPAYTHSEVIEAVFRRTRVTVGLMTAAKLLSAIEPVIRYQRDRYSGAAPGSPRHEMGLQQKEDVNHRLVDVWATGEAAAALGFAAARLFDELDPLERRVESILGEKILKTRQRTLRRLAPRALEYLELAGRSEARRDAERLAELGADPLVEHAVKSAVADVLCPACKLWCTGHGANLMRESVSLMGGSGITEECPGFLGQKWMDAQLEATYEGPESVQRRQLSVTMTDEVFLAQLDLWIGEVGEIAGHRPETGAGTLAAAMELWRWSLRHLLGATDATGKPLYRSRRQGVTFPMADALCWLLASRQQILDLLELAARAPQEGELAEEMPGWIGVLNDLCHVQAARAAGEVGRICSELVFGYNLHPSWDEDRSLCYDAEELEALEGFIPGIGAVARARGDVIEEDGSHLHKAGPDVRFDGMETFVRMRQRIDGSLSGARLAKDRAAYQLTKVSIPESLDYPAA